MHDTNDGRRPHLQQHRNERLDLEDLRGLLHHDRVVLEAELDELAARHRRVRARHRDDARRLGEEVVGALAPRAQQLQRTDHARARGESIAAAAAEEEEIHAFDIRP